MATIGQINVKVKIINLDELQTLNESLDELTDMIPDYYPEKEVLIQSFYERLGNLIEITRV